MHVKSLLTYIWLKDGPFTEQLSVPHMWLTLPTMGPRSLCPLNFLTSPVANIISRDKLCCTTNFC